VRIRLALTLALGLALALGPVPASAAPDRQVLLVVVAGRSYEQALRDPLLSELASAGGIGLLTTPGGADRASRTAVGLGAGRSAEDAPPGPVPFIERGGGVTVDVEPYRAEAGDATPGLLGSALSGAGLSVGYLDLRSGGGDVALLAGMDREGRIPSAFLGLGVPVETPTAPPNGTAEGIVAEADLLVSPDLEAVRFVLGRTEAGEVLVVVVGVGASDAMRERRDIASPIVLARGAPADLLGGDGTPAGLTSSTTRRDGIVADADVAPTILDFLSVPIPSEMTGSAIRSSGEPPTELHRRYLDYRGVVLPVDLALLGFAIASLVAGLVVIFVSRRPPPWLAWAVAVAILASAALLVALVPASVLPSYATALVVGCLLAVAVALVAIALRLGREDPRVAVLTVAVAGLAFVLLDGVLGWPSELTPMLGGGALEGERFFGLGNAHAGIVLAGAVLGASRLPTRAGVWLIAAASAFAGLPFLGADLGGCLTLAVAAALWYGLGRWRLGWRTWALAALALLGALILALAADRFLPGGHTHLTGGAGDGTLGALGRFGERFLRNLGRTSATPAAWLTVLGLPVWLAVALARPERLRPALDPDPRWRDAVIVLALGGIVGYLLNDTYGMASVAFTFTAAAIVYPTLAAAAAAAGADLNEPALAVPS
jgi:hypothetical protein